MRHQQQKSRMSQYIVIVVLLFPIISEVYGEQFALSTYDTNYHDQLICTGNCLQQLNKFGGRVAATESCIRECTNGVDNVLKASPANISLLCRDHKSLTVKFNDYFQTSASTITIFVVDVVKLNDIGDTPKVYAGYFRIITLDGLRANTVYDVNGTVIQIQVNRTIVDDDDVTDNSFSAATLSPMHVPGEVTRIHILKHFLMAGNKFNVLVSWTPPPDLPCNYSVRWQPKSSDDDSDQQHREFHQSDRYLLTDLPFGSKYEFSITSMSNTQPPMEGRINWNKIQMPTCLEWYRNDIDYCAPNMPENIQVAEQITVKHQYNLNVSWDKPLVRPVSYLIKILDYEEGHEATEHLAGDAIGVYMKNVAIHGLDYGIALTAFSPAGNATANVFMKLTKIYHNEIDTNRILRLTLYISLPAAIVMIVAIATAVYVNRRNKIQRMQVKFHKHMENREAPNDESRNELNDLLLEFPIEMDRMEVDPSQVDIFEKIGEGAFGFVRRGILRPAGIAVAVKTVKNSSSIDELREFLREIVLMKSVGQHPNIVGIIGHSTRNRLNMMLLTEYCTDGNLLDFLRNIWTQVHKVQPIAVASDHLCSTPAIVAGKLPESAFNFNTSFTDKYPIEHKAIAIIDERYMPIASPMTPRVDFAVNMAYETVISEFAANAAAGASRLRYVENPEYNDMVAGGVRDDDYTTAVADDDPTKDVGSKSTMYVDDEPILDAFAYQRRETIEVSYMDLLQFAKQIAQGMAFLSHNRVVHRDLAARNVLVGRDKKVKISDFGMSRDIYQLNMYLRSGDGKLPIKWLAIESMTHQLYTSQSDVWSYGVLLYEIMTLGGQPYPAIDVAELLKLLKLGYRMERPRNCNVNVYELMMMCWRMDPNERPKFAEIVQIVDRFIEMADEM